MQWIIVFTAIVVAFLLRALIGLYAPSDIGDGQTYLIVAENILQNSCVSLSDPNSGKCLPTWGGNQLPGYPAFIAILYSVFSADITSLIMAQSIISGLSIGYCTLVVGRYGGSMLQTSLVALILTLSPVSMPWVRFAFTESLTIAFAIVIFAELIRSLRIHRLCYLSISIFLTAAIFIRYDAALLALPVAIVAIAIHGFKKAFFLGFVIFAIISVPLATWWVRSINAGLGFWPTSRVSSDGLPVPEGYTAWWKTWIIHQYQYRDAVWVVTTRSYEEIKIPTFAYSDEKEKAEVESLINKLSSYSGKPIPKKIDDKFLALADLRVTEQPFQQWLGLPLIRAGIMWLNPFVSSGWPINISIKNSNTKNNSDILVIIRNNLGQSIAKASLAFYRLVLGCACIFLLIWSIRVRDGPLCLIISIAFVHALVRTIVLAEAAFIENRYLISAIPLMEISIIFGIVARINFFKKKLRINEKEFY